MARPASKHARADTEAAAAAPPAPPSCAGLRPARRPACTGCGRAAATARRRPPQTPAERRSMSRRGASRRVAARRVTGGGSGARREAGRVCRLLPCVYVQPCMSVHDRLLPGVRAHHRPQQAAQRSHRPRTSAMTRRNQVVSGAYFSASSTTCPAMCRRSTCCLVCFVVWCGRVLRGVAAACVARAAGGAASTVLGVLHDPIMTSS
jgi:hypothetical protein